MNLHSLSASNGLLASQLSLTQMEGQREQHRFTLLKAFSLLKRNGKKRAPSLDETLERSQSSLDHSCRYLSAADSVENDKVSHRDFTQIVDKEDVPAFQSKDLSNKQNRELNNRVASLAVQERLFGENHPDVLFALQSLAAFYRRRGEHALSLEIVEEIARRGERTQSVAHSIPSEIFLR